MKLSMMVLLQEVYLNLDKLDIRVTISTSTNPCQGFVFLNMVDFEPIIASRELISIYSVTDSPIAQQQALDWAAQQFHRMRIDYEIVPKIGENGQIEVGQSAAIIARASGRGGPINTNIIANGHIDVVPKGDGWTKEQGEMDGSIIYGRGSSDMKSGVVAQIESAKIARDSKDLPFDYDILIVAGEETTGWGTQQAVAYCKPHWRDYRHKAAVIGEPTSEMNGTTRVMNGNKGSFALEVTVTGDTGHAATPRGKINSIRVGRDIDYELERLGKEWDSIYQNSALGLPELVPTRVQAGVAANSLPPQNILTYNGRFPSELKDRYAEDLRRALSPFSDAATFKILYQANHAYTDPSDPWVLANLWAFNQKRAQLAPWTTDGCFFTEWDIPVVMAGPGFLNQLHEVDEMCDTRLIVSYAERIIQAGRFYVDLTK